MLGVRTMINAILLPIVAAGAAISRRYCVTNLFASARSSIMLLRSAKNGASGKAATKSVTKPN